MGVSRDFAEDIEQERVLAELEGREFKLSKFWRDNRPLNERLFDDPNVAHKTYSDTGGAPRHRLHRPTNLAFETRLRDQRDEQIRPLLLRLINAGYGLGRIAKEFTRRRVQKVYRQNRPWSPSAVDLLCRRLGLKTKPRCLRGNPYVLQRRTGLKVDHMQRCVCGNLAEKQFCSVKCRQTSYRLEKLCS